MIYPPKMENVCVQNVYENHKGVLGGAWTKRRVLEALGSEHIKIFRCLDNENDRKGLNTLYESYSICKDKQDFITYYWNSTKYPNSQF